MEPEFGGVITSAYHLHRATRLDGTSAIVRMGEILAPAAADLKTSDQSARARRARRIERRTSAGRVAVPEEHRSEERRVGKECRGRGGADEWSMKVRSR